MPRIISATYRLQLTRDFTLRNVRGLVPYFHDLGVSHLYLSPLLAARKGSQHGYDVVDHARLNPELGTEEELRALADDLHARAMGIILDVVPNHMAASAENPHWDDVLQRGRSSPYAAWFDVDWDVPHADGKVILPVLADELEKVIERDEIKPDIRESGARVAYGDSTFPLDPASLPQELLLARADPAGRPAADEWCAGEGGRARMRALLDKQRYRLVCWRRAPEQINYRRFFDVNDLVALRMASEAVFAATHRLILTWVRDGVLDGLRVDHIDGLPRPSWYLAKLRTEVDAAKHDDAPDRYPIFVEKILLGDERLPSQWPVEGTTGYDFMNDVEELFLDADGFRAIETSYRRLRRRPSMRFSALAREGKRRVLNDSLAPDVRRVARLAYAWRSPAATLEQITTAVVEVIVHLDVYRTYVGEPGLPSDADRRALAAAFRDAREHTEASEAALTLLEAAFFAEPTPGDSLRAELVMLFQQTSGPAMAKGVEDTALYVYVPLASRNEVGGEPDRSLDQVSTRMHARNALRARDRPRTMLATNTHDTKRSADLRSRLDVLTTMPAQWSRYVTRWKRLNRSHKRVVAGRPSPDTNTEYLYYQTLLGMWPAPRRERRVDDLPDRAWRARTRERLLAYMQKAAREAKQRTSWTERDASYEKALEEFVRATLEPGDDAPFLPDVARLTALVAVDGFRNALARLVLHCTSPGTPDLYQGDELWNVTLVDPDNRRPVDFRRREQLLRDREGGGPGTALAEDRTKLALTARLLRFRRDHPKLFRDGEYQPLLPSDADPRDVFAFARSHDAEAIITLARTGPPKGDTESERALTITLPDELVGRWESILTGRVIELVRAGHHLSAKLDQLLLWDEPCEVLFRVSR